MQEGANAKQQIVEKLKSSTNILVTVSSNPTVDALSAALSLTLMLNKMDKHATAVFSGAIPPAIKFLEPNKTFEGTMDSLRDFIIALDKDKADRLRYKVDGDMVRIFITPYRTSISEKDLKFSQGDFNVETIIALGVEQREELDKAIQAHGRILHDASVLTINNKNGSGNLGAVDWQDTGASSLSEMLMSMSEAMGTSLVDEQIATALLTGIVAATERFSNEYTKPRVMTMAAQLMAAGANQQLIAAKLESSHVIQPVNASKSEKHADKNNDGSMNLEEDAPARVEKTEGDDKENKKESDESGQEQAETPPPVKKPRDGEMQVEHDKSEAGGDDKQTEPLDHDTAGMHAEQIEEKKRREAVKAAEGALASAIAEGHEGLPVAAPVLADLERELQKRREDKSQPDSQDTESNNSEDDGRTDEPEPKKEHRNAPTWMDKPIDPPSMGGTLNATSEQALQDNLRFQEEERNRTILNHSDGPANENHKPAYVPTLDSTLAPPPVFSEQDNAPSPVPPSFGGGTPPSPVNQAVAPSTVDQLPPIAQPTPPVVGVDAARDAVQAALYVQPTDGDNNQPSAAFPPMPTPPAMPDYEPAPVPPPAGAFAPNVPSLPPLPDMSSLPPLPPPPSAPNAGLPLPGVPPMPTPQGDPLAPPPQQDSVSNNPGQFRIPGQ